MQLLHVLMSVLPARRKNVFHTEATRRTLIRQAPSVLRLLLKRFMYVLLPVHFLLRTCILSENMFHQMHM